MRTPPTSRCLALLRHFDPTNPDPGGAVNVAAAALEGLIVPGSFDDLNEGQFAALIDFVIWKGMSVFEGSILHEWIDGGNLTLPPAELAAYGVRGVSERDMWNLGNSE